MKQELLLSGFHDEEINTERARNLSRIKLIQDKQQGQDSNLSSLVVESVHLTSHYTTSWKQVGSVTSPRSHGDGRRKQTEGGSGSYIAL